MAKVGDQTMCKLCVLLLLGAADKYVWYVRYGRAVSGCAIYVHVQGGGKGKGASGCM